ncbi:S9 family peptidase [Propioniciclava soli]|uniref:S9 family peptidase n=1 Tax=Propioniciclava soli TaxID=2775081 RepID=A0ABZ3C901_9ACTN
MRPDQLELLLTPCAPAVHPDGTWAVVAATRPSFAADAYVGQLWRVDLSGTDAPRRLTRGVNDATPRFSPDGRLLGFLRGDADGRPQVFVVRTDGGEAAQVTTAPMGVGAFCWSPDAGRIAFVARVAEEGRYGTVDGVSPAQEDPRHLAGNQIQANGLGWSTDRRRRLFVVDVPDPDAEPPITPVGRAAAAVDADTPFSPVPTATELTTGAFDATDPVFSPDGASILFTSAREADRDETLRTGIHRVRLADAAPKPDDANTPAPVEPVAVDARLTFDHATPSRDGATLFCLGSDLGESGLDFVATNQALYATPVDGGEPRRLTDPATVELASAPVPVGDDAVLVIAAQRGTSTLLRVRADGTVTTLHEGHPTVLWAEPVPGSDAVVATVTDVDTPGEVARIDGGGVRLLTDFAAGLREATTIVEPRELVSTSPDGHPVHGWTLVPEGEGPHPVLLTIHGGPYASYPSTFFDEWQVFVAAGYAVVACNPRGAAGYGEEHGAAIRYAFGDLDMTDVLGFLDHATATVPGLDADRVGIMGGSYGGYLTAWIIAHDHRFAGAIVERGFLDPASFLGASDIGWFFMPQYNGADLEQQNRQSPTLLTHQVQTPTFVVHSELDLRCPLAQGLRYYASLKSHGVEAELLVFPGENHELSRSGTPWHRRQRFEKILDWWDRHLPVSAARGRE